MAGPGESRKSSFAFVRDQTLTPEDYTAQRHMSPQAGSSRDQRASEMERRGGAKGWERVESEGRRHSVSICTLTPFSPYSPSRHLLRSLKLFRVV